MDKKLSLAVGLRAIPPGEAVDDAQVATGLGESVRAIRDAIVGEDGVDLDAVEGVEADHLLERPHDAGDLFVGSMAMWSASTPAPSLRSARLPVPRTPGRRKHRVSSRRGG